MNSKYISVTKTTAQRMISAITRGLVLPLILFGAVAAAPPASAGVVSNHSGTICKNSAGPDATHVSYAGNAFLSYVDGPEETQIICPLTRNTSNSNGAYVYVDVYHNSVLFGQTTFCIAQSFNYKGESMAYASSESWAGEGFQEFVLDLSGAGKSDTWSDYSVTCFIPGHGRARVLGVDLSEQ